jgi:LPPG:FO 2-phospho-L-lactate transferase
MLVLSGGTGTPKLLEGLKRVVPEEEITVIVNTAEDLWVSGNLVCPDIDTVLYLFANKIDTDKWWGIRGDTFKTHERLKSLGLREILKTGDEDRSTHILRSELIRGGASLTEATLEVARRLGIRARVLPMANEEVASIIETSMGELHFQRFWVELKGEPEVYGVRLRGIKKASLSREVLEALRSEEDVIIGPSNPITSIGPILAVGKMRKRLERKRVVAVSPLIGDWPVSGPAGKLMRAKDLEVSSKGVAEYYRGLLEVFVIDERDPWSPGDNKFEVRRTDILMTSVEESVRLARFICSILEEL